jgi:hypothetical protein
MAVHSARIINAEIASEGDDTVIRIPGQIDLQPGSISMRLTEQTGEIILTPVAEMSDRHKKWLSFLDELAARPSDEEFMRERPMNSPPLEKSLFPDA